MRTSLSIKSYGRRLNETHRAASYTPAIDQFTKARTLHEQIKTLNRPGRVPLVQRACCGADGMHYLRDTHAATHRVRLAASGSVASRSNGGGGPGRGGSVRNRFL